MEYLPIASLITLVVGVITATVGIILWRRNGR